MIKNASFLTVLVSTVVIIASGYGERTKDQMYEYMNGRTNCFRRMNATHQTGCSSKRDGSVGVLHYVEDHEDLIFLLENGLASAYIPVMPTRLMNTTNLKQLQDSGKISGLILYDDNSNLTQYSHELSCPNPRSNLEGTCEKAWNAPGTGILHMDIPFPIYLVESDGDLQKMVDCFAKFNNFSYESQSSRSLCAVEIDAFMYATTDTPTCMRRSNLHSVTNLNPVKFCDPLGGENVWYTLFPLRNVTAGTEVRKQKFIVVAARIDTTSMFHGAFPGAASPVTGVVTLLATAELLKRIVNESGTPEDFVAETNVLFVLFNGESYDYIGSQRMVYDMENDEFPMKIDPEIKNPLPLITLDDVTLFVELSQLMKAPHINIHMSSNASEITSFVKRFNEKIKKSVKQRGAPLPPSSLQSFLAARSNLSGLIVADYSEEYTNKYFNSIYDNASNVNFQYYNVSEGEEIPHDSIQKHTGEIAEALAGVLYVEVMKQTAPEKVDAKLDIINELYNCYLLDPDCKVHQAISKKKLRESAYNSYNFYVGVTVSPNLLTYAIGLTLGWLTGDIVYNRTCHGDYHTPVYQYFNMSESIDNLNNTLCFRTTMNFTEAVSPAFVIDDYDFKSNKYSSWTESTWKDLTVRMFLKPSAAHEAFTLAIGGAVFILSFVVVYFVKSRSHILFVAPENCSPTSC